MGQYGYLEVPSNSTGEPTLANAGVLGDIRGAVVSPRGELFVLDRYAHQVVVFDTAGTVRRVVRGGGGDGPGEFRLPMHIAQTQGGFSVVDYDLRRLTEFDWVGTLLRTVRLQTPAPWKHVVRGDTAWIAYSHPDSSAGPVFHRVDLVTAEVAAGPRLHPEDQPYGVSVGMALLADGRVLVNTARPGVWMEQHGEHTYRRGVPLYPHDRPPMTEEIGPRLSQVTPAQYTSSGLVVLADSIVLQGILSLARPFDWDDPPERDEYVRSLGVFRRDGSQVATVQLPPGALTQYMAADAARERVLLPFSDPFPHLREYRLAPCVN